VKSEAELAAAMMKNAKIHFIGRFDW
jgi:hypothetical protein